MNLSPNFTLDEFIISQEAVRRGIDNTPPEYVIIRLSALCMNILEPVRRALGPVIITSGYRCPALNAAIGGSSSSQHMEGRAADIHVPVRTLEEVYNYIYRNLLFDQLIREFPPGGWVHASYDPQRSRKESLLAQRGPDGRTAYSPLGLIA